MTMVVVGLIAAMAFQAAVSPPGGVWQDDTSSHRAGKAVMASSHPKLYKLFSRANTTAFVSFRLYSCNKRVRRCTQKHAD
ncbi:hypothetical protein AAHA92_26570 [Salvia divinorum]|uniref:PGG domain-containing protein n=1 Tax=Salvia divinorum TaxID=28513 RepID=A0ABD1GED7_SALDI